MNNLKIFHGILAQAYAEIDQLLQHKSFFECTTSFFVLPKHVNQYTQVFDIEFKMLDNKPCDVTYSVMIRKESFDQYFVNTVVFGSITKKYCDFEYEEKTLFKADLEEFTLPHPKTLGTISAYSKHLVVTDFLMAYKKLTENQEKKPKLVTTLDIAVQQMIVKERKLIPNIN